MAQVEAVLGQLWVADVEGLVGIAKSAAGAPVVVAASGLVAAGAGVAGLAVFGFAEVDVGVQIATLVATLAKSGLDARLL